MNLFDESELDKKIAEAEAALIKDDEEKQLDTKEVEEDIEEEAEVQEEEREEKEEAQDDVAEEDLEPTDAKGWKKLREKKKAAQAQLEEEKRLREQKEKELYELRERLARLEGREDAREKPKISQEPEDKEPDSELDPEEHIRWELRQVKKAAQEANKRAEKAEAMAKMEGVRRGLDMVEKDYIKNNKITDYTERLEHVKSVERNLIKLRYPSATDEQINSHLEVERVRVANEAYSNGQNPAEMFYKMSEALGYKKAEARKELSDNPDIGAIKRNMSKNANLIGSSNVEKPGGLPAEKLVSMSIADLMNSKNERALDLAIKREEQRMMGL